MFPFALGKCGRRPRRASRRCGSHEILCPADDDVSRGPAPCHPASRPAPLPRLGGGAQGNAGSAWTGGTRSRGPGRRHPALATPAQGRHGRVRDPSASLAFAVPDVVTAHPPQAQLRGRGPECPRLAVCLSVRVAPSRVRRAAGGPRSQPAWARCPRGRPPSPPRGGLSLLPHVGPRAAIRPAPKTGRRRGSARVLCHAEEPTGNIPGASPQQMASPRLPPSPPSAPRVHTCPMGTPAWVHPCPAVTSTCSPVPRGPPPAHLSRPRLRLERLR